MSVLRSGGEAMKSACVNRLEIDSASEEFTAVITVGRGRAYRRPRLEDLPPDIRLALLTWLVGADPTGFHKASCAWRLHTEKCDCGARTP